MFSLCHFGLQQLQPSPSRGDQPRAVRLRPTARRARACSWLLLMLFLVPGALVAQLTGAITGTVTDETGGALPNAEVTLIKPAQGTSSKTTTSEAGEFYFSALEAGIYNLRVVAPGFKAFDATGIVLRVSRTEKIDAKLTVGSVNTEVEVTGK